MFSASEVEDRFPSLPTLSTLKKYVEAVGCRLDVRVVPAKDR
jgi:hypothetical protein